MARADVRTTGRCRARPLLRVRKHWPRREQARAPIHRHRPRPRLPRPRTTYPAPAAGTRPRRDHRMSTPTITVVGNLTADPELRYTQGGAPVANFTIAATDRVKDKNTGEWKDGDPLFLRCSLWREAAENVAESLTKGTRVIAQGRLVQRDYETREGEKRTVYELQ